VVYQSSCHETHAHVISFPSDDGNGMFCLQKEYILAKPARDVALGAKMEAESLSVEEGPLHADRSRQATFEH
jgi:hypothetical protein